MGKSMRSIPLALVLGTAAVCLPASSCGEPESTIAKPTKEVTLLDAGIAALWNGGPAAEINAVEVHSIYRQNKDDIGEQITSCTQPDANRYFEERVSCDIEVIHVLDGQRAWAAIDGTPVPLPKAEQVLLGLHPFLFSVSLLQVLKDKSRFELSHKGTVTLENQIQAERLQVSPVGDDILSKMTITLDFGARDHLVRRVELKADGDANPHVLFMDDHRPVAIHGSPGSHMMVAFRLTAHRNKKRLGFETVTEVTFNQPRADSFFDEKPTRDKTRRVKPCIGGRIAFVEIPTDESDRVDQRAQDLKVWVEENELQTAGPLVFVRELSADQPNEKRVTRVFIPIASGADPEKQHKLFSIEQAETATAICKTLVADGDFSETIASLRGDADNRGKTPMALAYEIHFTPDGSTRQIQLLLKED